jgi:hypothetical protein
MCDWVGCDREPRWLLQSNFAPVRPNYFAVPEVEASYCRPHMAETMRDHTEALLTTHARITITRTG